MIRRLVVAAVGLIVLLLAAAAGVYWFLGSDTVREAIERQASAWLGQPVRIENASVTLLPRTAVRLRQVRVGEPVRVAAGEVLLTVPFAALLSRNVEGGAVTISNSRIELPLPLTLGSGAASQPTGLAPPIRISSIREIRLRDVTVVSRGRSMSIEADLSLDGSRLDVDRFTATSATTSLEAGGYAELAPRVNVTIESTAERLDVEELIALLSAVGADTLGAATGEGRAPRMFARIAAPRAQVAGFELRQFAATVVAEGGLLMIEPLAFEVFGGRQNGWMDVQLGPELQMRIGATVADLDAGQLAAFAGAAGAVTGTLGGSGRFGAAGADVGSMLASIRGVGDIVVTNGSVRGLDAATAVARFLGQAAPARSDGTGERFSELKASFSLGDGALHSSDLALRAADYDILANGSLTLGTTALNGRADLVLSEELSKQSNRNLYRFARAGTRVVLPAIVGGTLARPQIRIDTAAALKRGAVNELERRLEGLLQRVKPS